MTGAPSGRVTAEVRATYLAAEVRIAEGAVLVDAAESELLRNGTVHVVTAWNPGALRPTEDENRTANRALRARIVQLGFQPHRAVGCDPASPHHEEGWAVVGMSDESACALGAEFGQDAVFRIDPGTLTVLACDGSWSDSRPL